jgi:cytochrome d ubiquinol oxidase subunit II
MTAAQALLVLGWLGLTMYALLGGADFGGGFWDAVAGEGPRGLARRGLIDHAIGPVWEANHVWLIFVLVLFWTCFPLVFASVLSTMYVPLTLVALGVIARGSAFAFRKAATELWQARLFGGAFALSSVLTPFFLGTVAGGVASGRVPPGLARGDLLRSWWNPTSVLGGLLAVGSTAYLAAVYVTGDARRTGRTDLAEDFRRRGLATAVVTGLIALGGILVLRTDAPGLYAGLTGPALPIVIVSAAGGLASIALLFRRAYVPARGSAAVAAAAVLWGWAVAQYPVMLPGLTVSRAAAEPAVLHAMLAVTIVGLILLVPSLLWLFALSQSRAATEPGGAGHGTP